LVNLSISEDNIANIEMIPFGLVIKANKDVLDDKPDLNMENQLPYYS